MVPLAGKSGPAEARAVIGAVPIDAKLSEEQRQTPVIASQVARLSESVNPWIKEAARIASNPGRHR